MDWMSQDLAARLSARAAQGIGAGLLTARLGIKAMELCRPLPWIADDKPRLGDFRRELIGQLKRPCRKANPPGEVTSAQTSPGGALPGLRSRSGTRTGNIRLGAFRRQPLAEGAKARAERFSCGQIRS